MQRIAAAAVAATIVALGAPGLDAQVASASNPPDPGCGLYVGSDKTIINLGACSPGSTPTPDAQPLSTPVCTSAPVSGSDTAGLLNSDPTIGVTISGDSGTGTWYLVTCGSARSLVYVGKGQPAPTGPSPAVLAQWALAKMRLIAPTLAMAPPTIQLVNFPDWLAVDAANWKPISAKATAGPVSVTAVAQPVSVSWDFGGADQVVCAGPGTPWNPSIDTALQHPDCSYTWRHDSFDAPGGRYNVTARINYKVTWTATGAPGGGDLGTIAGDPAQQPVSVVEYRVVNGG